MTSIYVKLHEVKIDEKNWIKLYIFLQKIQIYSKSGKNRNGVILRYISFFHVKLRKYLWNSHHCISFCFPTFVTNDLYFMTFLNDRIWFSLNRYFADKSFLIWPCYVLSRLDRNRLFQKNYIKNPYSLEECCWVFNWNTWNIIFRINLKKKHKGYEANKDIHF